MGPARGSAELTTDGADEHIDRLARKYTGRETIVSFTNAFHGMTLGALSVTGNSMKRGGAGIPLVHATPMPYDNYLDGQVEDFLWFERLLDDTRAGRRAGGDSIWALLNLELWYRTFIDGQGIQTLPVARAVTVRESSHHGSPQATTISNGGIA